MIMHLAAVWYRCIRQHTKASPVHVEFALVSDHVWRGCRYAEVAKRGYVRQAEHCARLEADEILVAGKSSKSAFL